MSQTNQQAITSEVAQKVLEAVDHGLVRGTGVQVPGKMCVEAAVCFALGLPHSDNPPCVHATVRELKIALNDSSWSSPTARAAGMRRVAVAQLGSLTIDDRKFTDYVVLETVRRILPKALTAAGLTKEAERCAAVSSLEEWREISDEIRDAANTDDTAYAAYCAARAYAVADAAFAVAYAAYAADAVADADADADKRDEVLSLAAEIAVEALVACGSEGAAFLYLTEGGAA